MTGRSMLGFTPHDHNSCVATALSVVEDVCIEKGLQLTPTRRRVLEILLEQHQALPAYAILDVLRAEGLGSQPPVVYRALDFLMVNGFAHKIERKNAFVACAHPGEAHAPAFLICRSCDLVMEAASKPDHSALGTSAKDTGFVIETAVQEAQGLCPVCQEDTNADPTRTNTLGQDET